MLLEFHVIILNGKTKDFQSRSVLGTYPSVHPVLAIESTVTHFALVFASSEYILDPLSNMTTFFPKYFLWFEDTVSLRLPGKAQ